MYSALQKLNGAWLANPDYRIGVLNPDALARAGTESGGQDVGLAVVMLETLANHYDLVDSLIADSAAAIYDECAGGATSSTLERMRDWYGRTARWALTIEAIANELHERAVQSEATIVWEERWMQSR